MPRVRSLLSFKLESWLAQSIAACGLFCAQAEAMAKYAWERWYPGSSAALAAAVVGSCCAHCSKSLRGTTERGQEPMPKSFIRLNAAWGSVPAIAFTMLLKTSARNWLLGNCFAHSIAAFGSLFAHVPAIMPMADSRSCLLASLFA